MLSFILVMCGILIFIRIYLNKFDIDNKDLIAIILSLALTSFLTIIQLFIDFIIKIFIKG